MQNRCGYTILFTNGHGTAIAHGKAKKLCVITFSKVKLPGGNFHGCVKNTKRNKVKETTTSTKTNKQTNKQNFHDSSRSNFYGLNKNPQLN